MITFTHRAGVMVVGISLLLASVGHGSDKKTERADSKSPPATAIVSGDSAKKHPGDEPAEAPESTGLVKEIGEQLHQAARKERIATLAGVDKQRLETLAYLTLERRMTMFALEAMGDRIVENAIRKSERLIDHFFIRTMQLAAVIILTVCILGFLFFRLLSQRQSQS